MLFIFTALAYTQYAMTVRTQSTKQNKRVVLREGGTHRARNVNNDYGRTVDRTVIKP